MFDWLIPSRSSELQSSNPYHFINPKSSLYIQCTPSDPHTASNIVITAFSSKQHRTIVPIRVEWSRSVNAQVLKTNNYSYPIEKITSHRSNTYMCEPSDLGVYLHAKSLDDDSNRKQAQITIGPIRIDVMIKRLMQGAMFSGSLLSQVVLIDGQKQKNATLRLNIDNIEIIEDQTQAKFETGYQINEPKFQLNPKDSTKVYLRFEHDQKNRVFNYLNKIFDRENKISLMMEQSNSQRSSSRTRLFKNTHCLNKLEFKFISRHTRDLFLFMHKAFICKQMLKSTIIFERMQKMQMLGTQEDYKYFLQFISLREQINRLCVYAKQLQYDRNKKIKDMNQLEQSISELTLSFMKMIEDKGKLYDIDLNRSYSQVSQKRQQMMHRRNFRELKEQNENLNKKVHELKQQIEIIKFFKKQQNNDSIQFNQTNNNPFMKKQLKNQSEFHWSPENNSYKQENKNVLQLSKTNMKLLRENQELKRKYYLKQTSKDKDMLQLLNSIHDDDSKQQQQRQIIILKKQIESLKKKLNQKDNFQKVGKSKLSHSIAHSLQSQSMHSNASQYIDPNAQNQSINFNQSMTSQAQFKLLQDKFFEIKKLNEKILQENSRLRKQRDHYRQLVKQYKKKQHQDNSFNVQGSLFVKIKQENQQLINQRNSLRKKIDSLLKENNQIKANIGLQNNKDQSQLQKLKTENSKLKSQIDRNQPNKQLFASSQQRLKRINCDLLDEVKQLKIKLDQNKFQLMNNSKVIELQNQNAFLKKQTSQFQGSQQLLQQLGLYAKEIQRLKQQNQIKQSKLQTQITLIQKLMNTNNNHQRSHGSEKHSDFKQTKSQCKSQEVVQKYKKKIKQLQEQIIILRRSSDVLNRSRDLSIDCSGYYQDKAQALTKEIKILIQNNQNLSNICQKYSKDARQYQKLKKQILNSGDSKLISILGKGQH